MNQRRRPRYGCAAYLGLWAFCFAAVLFFAWPWVAFGGVAGTVAGCIWVPVALVLLGKAKRGVVRRLRQSEPSPFSPLAPVPGRPRLPVPHEVKQYVWVRDGGRCRHCRISDDDSMALHGEHLQFDHVIPWSRGGTNEAENIQLLCGPDNRAKGAQLNWRG